MYSCESYRLPAEWEPQSAIQLTWPHRQTDWAPMLDDICDTYREMRRLIERYEPVIVVGTPDGEPSEATFRCPTNDTWARDHAFLTLVPTAKRMGDSDAETRAPLLLDFRFNGWGEKFAADLDNAINRRLYDAGVVRGEYVDCLDFVLEGGSIESDGRGTIFTTTPCLLAPHRNQPLTKEQIEAELKRRLCARRIVWIDHGQLVGDDTDGHIDTLVRIAPDDTLLYVGCDDTEDEQYEELRLMEEELRQLRTLEGRPYRLLKLPMPRPIYERGERREERGENEERGERLPATYANFLIVNGAVLVPTYAQPDLDAEACRIIGEAFPGRDIVGLDCRTIIRQHGSLHCCTMQYPREIEKLRD